MLTFNEKEHKYYYEGKCLPSVTQIMRSITTHSYSEANEYALNYARDKGHQVHKAIYDYEMFDDYELEDKYKPIFEKYLKWKEEYKPKILYQEVMLSNGIYAGTIDMIAEINGEVCIIDFKTSNELHNNFVSVQLTAYDRLCYANEINVNKLYALHLTKDKYEFVEEKHNDEMWLKCYDCYRFAKEV